MRPNGNREPGRKLTPPLSGPQRVGLRNQINGILGMMPLRVWDKRAEVIGLIRRSWDDPVVIDNLKRKANEAIDAKRELMKLREQETEELEEEEDLEEPKPIKRQGVEDTKALLAEMHIKLFSELLKTNGMENKTTKALARQIAKLQRELRALVFRPPKRL